jgi:hypothetical protein
MVTPANYNRLISAKEKSAHATAINWNGRSLVRGRLIMGVEVRIRVRMHYDPKRALVGTNRVPDLQPAFGQLVQ